MEKETQVAHLAILPNAGFNSEESAGLSTVDNSTIRLKRISLKKE
jgi:hypothetical protein